MKRRALRRSDDSEDAEGSGGTGGAFDGWDRGVPPLCAWEFADVRERAPLARLRRLPLVADRGAVLPRRPPARSRRPMLDQSQFLEELLVDGEVLRSRELLDFFLWQGLKEAIHVREHRLDVLLERVGYGCVRDSARLSLL